MNILIGYGIVLAIVVALIIHLLKKMKKEKEFYTKDTKTKYTRINGGIIVTEKHYEKRNMEGNKRKQ